jgi:hypothetical protein
MLCHLGFEIVSSRTLIDSEFVYSEEFSEHENFRKARVYLVTSQLQETDRCAFAAGPSEPGASLPVRVLPMKGIPIIVFGALRFEFDGIDVDLLCAIWDDVFRLVFRSFGQIQVKIWREVLLATSQRAEASACSLFYLLVPQFENYLPGYDWEHEFRLSERPFRLTGREDAHRHNLNTDESVLLNAILLATVYSVCCKSLCLDQEDVALVEVAVEPNLLVPTSKVNARELFSVVRQATELDGILIDNWVSFVHATLCGEISASQTRWLP